MFSLMCGLWSLAFTKKEHRILILGLDGAGKTTTIEKLKSLYLGLEMLPKDKIFPTIGLNIARFEVPKARLVFWDLGGEASLRSIWEKYTTSNLEALVFVVDGSDPSRLSEAETVFENLLSPSTPGGARLRSLPVLLLVNKRDMQPFVVLSEVEARFNRHLAKYNDRKVKEFRAIEVSAISG